LILFARLVTLAKHKQNGIRLVLCDASAPITKVLKVSRFIQTESGPDGLRLLLTPDLKSALAALA
jgi:hypothetical protein